MKMYLAFLALTISFFLTGCGQKQPVENKATPLVVETASSSTEEYVPDKISYVPNVAEQADMIEITSLKPDEKISDVIMVEGRARAWWFAKDGQFTMRLTDAEGETIGQFTALALTDVSGKADAWVPWRVSLVYEYPKSDTGFLVAERFGWEEILGGWKNMLVFPIGFKK